MRPIQKVIQISENQRRNRHKRRLLLVGALIGIGLLAAGIPLSREHPTCSSSACIGLTRTSAPAPVAAGYYGVNADLAFSSSSADWDASAAEIARLGVGTVRKDAFWAAVEPTPPKRGVHRYRWQSTDRFVEALAKSGLRWYPIVDYSTTWAGVSGVQSPPAAAYVSDYAAFAGALARRYGPGGRFWRLHPRLRPMPVQNYEIWNEPNVVRFWPEQSYAPQRLAAMYLAAQTQIKASDPSAQVVLGGLSVEGVESFLTRMVRIRPLLLRRLEAVGFHPYGGGPNAGLQTTYARIRSLRSTLDQLFPSRSVPIEITETGWAVPWVPETWRSQRLQQLAIELPRSNCDITRFIVYAWTSTESGPSPEAYFGIARANGTLTESATAYGAGIARMRAPGLASTGTIDIC